MMTVQVTNNKMTEINCQKVLKTSNEKVWLYV